MHVAKHGVLNILQLFMTGSDMIDHEARAVGTKDFFCLESYIYFQTCWEKDLHIELHIA